MILQLTLPHLELQADGPSGVWDSSLVMMGAAYTTPGLDAGEYPYFCMVHPFGWKD
ncbi:MAG: hypothetical protein Ct9H300mP17_01960 [Candidatus Nitrosopelagicus sp.]|nr:MAG: hypothetical protein Ct9H300mP17_01960 [Candidatus Nitrosopelagicus sp.]